MEPLNEPCCGPSPSGGCAPSAGPSTPPDEADDALLARFAKAVGHPARVQILRFLTSRESCICGDVVDEIGLAQSTVSQHLKVLKEAGLVRGEIDPPRVCYCIDPAALEQFKRLVAGL